MMHVWCHYEFRITNMKFALVTRGLTNFQRDFEWDLRQAIFKLILVINGWNCAQTNVMGAYWSVYIGSNNYLNQCSQRSMSLYDVTGSQRLEIGRPYHSWTSFREKPWAIQVSWSIHITITSWWARWHPKSAASWFFTQPFIRTQIKENIKVPRRWPLWGNSPVTSVWPTQKVSDAEKNSSWWRHHDPFMNVAQWFQTKNDDQLTSTKQCSGQVCILYDEAWNGNLTFLYDFIDVCGAIPFSEIVMT